MMPLLALVKLATAGVLCVRTLAGHAIHGPFAFVFWLLLLQPTQKSRSGIAWDDVCGQHNILKYCTMMHFNHLQLDKV